MCAAFILRALLQLMMKQFRVTQVTDLRRYRCGSFVEVSRYRNLYRFLELDWIPVLVVFRFRSAIVTGYHLCLVRSHNSSCGVRGNYLKMLRK